MTFEELLTAVKTMKCNEKRADEKDYCEVVMAKAQMPAMIETLQTYFGNPLKPEGENPSADAKRYADSHGGIHSNQTLYHRQNGGGSEMALLWPWGSGQAVTVKIVRQ